MRKATRRDHERGYTKEMSFNDTTKPKVLKKTKESRQGTKMSIKNELKNLY